MTNTLGRSLHLCFSMIKRPQPQIIDNPPHHHHNNHLSQPTTTTTTTFIKNYNSLYEAFTDPPPTAVATSDTEMDDVVDPTTPDLTAVYASRRFFISYPGRSNSIVDDESSSSSSEVAGGVAVETYSPDPYTDFRQSMQEMVEARELHVRGVEGKEAWEYLQELLLSYLSLNPKSTHKYIVGAFADVIFSLMSNSPNNNNNNNPSFSSYSSSSRSSSFCDARVGDNGGDDSGGYI